MTVAAVAHRQPFANTTNRPWQQAMKTAAASATTTPSLSSHDNNHAATAASGAPIGTRASAYATGGGVSAVRSSRPGQTTPFASTAPAMAETPRSTGGAMRNSPNVGAGSTSGGEPCAPSSPATNNPRAAAGTTTTTTMTQRELFPTSSGSGVGFTPYGQPARSATFAGASRTVGGAFGGSRLGPLGNHLSSFATLPTNTSLDSAMFGQLHSDSRFLIPPFRAPPRPAETPDVFNVATPKDKDLAGPAATPPKPNYFTIVFDLDETLCCNRGPGRAVLRPGCLDILKSLRAMSTPDRVVEIILWTASVESLARQVLVRLDPDGSIFSHLIFRDRRWFKETGYTKDLRLLGRDMERVVIIENSPMSVTLNRQQAILVKDFLGHAPHDTDLKAVKEVLEAWISAERFVPIREWLGQHPRIDRNNHVIAAPALNAIVHAQRGGPASTSTTHQSATMSSTSMVGGLRRTTFANRTTPTYSRRF